MNVVVLLKQTFDTEEKIEIVNGAVAEASAKFIINPYDEYALEEALRIKEAAGGTVTVVTCGPDRAAETLRTALAMGADDAVLLADEGLPDDGYAVAAALAAIVKELSPDLILAGLFAVDRGAGSIALQVAERLGLPHVSAAVKLSFQGGAALAERDTEWGLETVEVPLPALITAQQGLNEPRYPSLPGIMKAKRKPLRQLTAAELGLAPEELEPRSERLGLYAPAPRAAGRKLSGTPAEQAAALAALLQQEAKLFQI